MTYPSFHAVDLFCGGGGASEGIRLATGRAPRVAVNHCEHAIEMHAANHPDTIHLQTGVHDVTPMRGPGGHPVDLLWLSPDCTHFSRAKGGKPRKKSIRDLAWVAVDWAEKAPPRVIALENVPEFLTWGPLDDEGQPIKERAGETFRAFVAALEDHGYQVDWRVLVAADYGTPTTRKRLFLVARRDGAPQWPAKTHGPGLTPHRTAAECIDWSLPSLSIFATKAEAKAWAKATGNGIPKRPLAPNTQRRIAEGLRRYALTAADPYIVRLGHTHASGAYAYPSDSPLTTITTKAGHLLCMPHLTKFYGTANGASIADPMPTVTSGGGKGGGHVGLVSAHIQSTHSRPTYRAADKPLATITASYGGHQALVQAWIAKHYTGVIGHGMRKPLGTITAWDHHSLCEATAIPGEHPDRSAQVAAFIVKYYGSGPPGQALGEPLHTIVSRARFGLVTVVIDGELWTVVDISMRMLQPRELATAQGFGPEYILTGTKAQQIARIGNSVPPQVVAAVVAANRRTVARVSNQLNLLGAA